MNKNRLFFSAKTVLSNSAYWMFSLFGQNSSTLSVLCYHSISRNSDRYSISYSLFEEQIFKISNFAGFVSLDKALSVSRGGDIQTPAVVLTVDDGYEDVLQILPLTKRLKIPVTLFVLSNPELANREELNHKGKLLTTKQLKYLISQGWSIGCHSATHSDFYQLSPRQLKEEIIDSKKDLEKKLGIKIDYFAYPKGRYTEEILQAVKKAGYKAAFAISPGCIESKSDIWRLPRTIIDKTHRLVDFPAVFSPSNFLLRKATDNFHIWERFLNGQ